MNKADYLAALAHELRGLPPEEQRNALQYYEDYFADAGEENEETVIRELGTPQEVAREILRDFRELATVPQAEGRRGITPATLVLILVLVVLFWPVALGAIGILIGLVIVAVFLALAGLVGGFVSCGIGIVTMFGAPASGLLMLGFGFMMLAGGFLLAALLGYLCVKLVPPIIRGIVRLCRIPFERGKRS